MSVVTKFKYKIENQLEKFYWSMGVDLGSSNVLVYLKDKGIVVDEPSLVARHKKKRWTGLTAPKVTGLTLVAYGAKAKEMINREPKQIEVVAPIKNGIISDLAAAESLVAHYLKMVNEVPSKYPKLLKPRIIAAVPSSITEVQKRAVRSVFKSAGASDVILVEEAVLAAIGAGLPIDTTAGLMMVDIGGGKTEASLVSLGGVVVGEGTKNAGDDMDWAILNYIKMKYGLLVGINSAERVKIEIGDLSGGKETMIIRGRDLATGLPRSIKLGSGEIAEALAMVVPKIVGLVKIVLDQTPPELMEDILKRGIMLTGNGSKLKGISRLLEEETRISTRVVDDPGLCVARGLGILVENPAAMEHIKLVMGI